MTNHSIADKELLLAFDSIKINTSTGFDEISARVVKDCKLYIFDPLKHIFSLSLQTGIFPDKLKIARVTPIFCFYRSLKGL